MEQRPALQGQHFHILEAVPGGLPHFGIMARLIILQRHVRHLRHIPRLREEIITFDELPRKGEDVASLARAKIEPEVSLRVHLEGRRMLFPVRRFVPDGVGSSLHGVMPQPREEVFQRKPFHRFYVHRRTFS